MDCRSYNVTLCHECVQSGLDCYDCFPEDLRELQCKAGVAVSVRVRNDPHRRANHKGIPAPAVAHQAGDRVALESPHLTIVELQLHVEVRIGPANFDNFPLQCNLRLQVECSPGVMCLRSQRQHKTKHPGDGT